MRISCRAFHNTGHISSPRPILARRKISAFKPSIPSSARTKQANSTASRSVDCLPEDSTQCWALSLSATRGRPSLLSLTTELIYFCFPAKPQVGTYGCSGCTPRWQPKDLGSATVDAFGIKCSISNKGVMFHPTLFKADQTSRARKQLWLMYRARVSKFIFKDRSSLFGRTSYPHRRRYKHTSTLYCTLSSICSMSSRLPPVVVLSQLRNTYVQYDRLHF